MEFSAYLERETVRSVGFRPPVTISPDAQVSEAIERMQAEAVGCLLVVDGAERLIGIFTERDLLQKVLTTHADATIESPLSAVMTPQPIFVRSEDSLGKLFRLMWKGGFRHLPLLGADDRLLGSISIKRVVSYLADQFPEIVYNLPPEPENFGAAREGA